MDESAVYRAMDHRGRAKMKALATIPILRIFDVTKALSHHPSWEERK